MTGNGRIITDIDLIEKGILWEEKSPVFVGDVPKWVNKHVTGKLNRYLEAQAVLPGCENATIGLWFTSKIVDPSLTKAVEDAVAVFRQNNPGVTVHLKFTP